MKTYKNFLDQGFFEKIKQTITHKDFPWRRRDRMTTDINDAMYFTHNFYNNMNIRSEWFEPYIIPILKKLEAEAPIQVRANMSISALYETSQWHCDYNFKCKTAVLYLNDCDGGTELKIDNKIIFIKADANKMLVFDADLLHRAITSKKEPIRYIVNFNYFTKD